jgi:hypothetical protein
MIGPEFPEEVPTRVPERTLRQFAGLCLAIFGGLFALSWYRHQHAPNLAGWIAGAMAMLIGMLGLIRPNAIRPVYLGAMALTKPIGHVVGLALLAVVYYGMLMPLALAFRLAGRDGLGRYRRRGESYWVDHVPTVDVRLYLRQYQQQVIGDQASAAGAPAPAPARSAAPATVAELSEPHSPALPGASHGSA